MTNRDRRLGYRIGLRALISLVVGATAWPLAGRQLHYDIDSCADVEPLVFFSKALKLFVRHPEARHRFGVMDEARPCYTASQVEADEQDQGSVGKPF